MGKYADTVFARSQLAKEKQNGAIIDESGAIGNGVGTEAINDARYGGEDPLAASGSSALANAGQGVGSQMAQSGAANGSLGQTAGGALMMTGNPYLMAAGLGLSVVSAGEQNKRAAEEKQRLEYNERIKQRQATMAQIADMGIK